MKYALLFISLTAIIAGSGYYVSPETFSRTGEFLGEVSDSLLYSRELHVAGNTTLSRDRIISRLPGELSNIGWLTTPQDVEQSIKLDPMVRDVEVARCGFFSFRCFHISVVERQPAFVTQLGQKPWLVSKDGGFLSPAPEVADDSYPVVDGVLTTSMSPELMKSRLAFVARAIALLEDVLGARARHVTMNNGAELSVSFRELPFPVVFNGSKSQFDRLEIEAKRLKEILTQPGLKLHQIEEVDLAFKRLGIVRLKEEDMKENK